MKTRLKFFLFSLVLSSLVFCTDGFAQTAPLEYYIQSYELQSGIFNGEEGGENRAVEVFSSVIEIDNSPWLQLHFSDVNLGSHSYLILRSLYDNKWQKLDAVSIDQWNNFSAFFNGSAVELKLFLAQSDQQVFVNIDEVVVGEWANGYPPESQCGPTDDRTASNQPATARLLNVGCTAWIIPNGKFVSAGHCLAGNTSIVEFNVPLSLSNGTIQHPGPEDQYSVDVSTKIYTNGGVGNDWGVFEVFPNSITGLMPKVVQNAYWPLVQDLGPDSIRITGYGVDAGTANQTQQTHIGPNAGSSGTTMRYVTDTEGGNSGSPIIDGLLNVAVGVHTHGGCTTSGSGNNNGTSTFHAAFWAAVDEGAIPVELTSLKATVSESEIELTWITATETNNSGFEIQRSRDSEFITIDFVEGNGTTTESQAYAYTDKKLSVGNYVYRLKQIDFDGTFSYSQTIEVEVVAPNGFGLEQNYPNPFNPSTTIMFSIPVETEVSLNVYNTLGQEVAEIFNGRMKEGYHEVEFNAESLTSGIYFYRLEVENFVDVKKMILLK